MAPTNLERLNRVAEALAADPTFGDAQAIRERSAAFGHLALCALARDHAPARALLQELEAAPRPLRRRALLDPVIRDVIARATADPSDPSVELLGQAGELISEGNDWPLGVPPLDGHVVRARDETAHVLCVERLDTPFGRHFQRMFDENLSMNLAVGKMTLRSPTSDELESLRDGSKILADAVGATFASVLAHVDVVAIVDAATDATNRMVDSFSWVQFPSTIFLSPRAFRGDYFVAESLFHEATHHKHYDLRRSRTIVARDYVQEDAVEIVAHWNPATRDEDQRRWPDDNRWPSARAASAGHVYVYLSLLFSCLCEREGLTRALVADAQRCTDRARYLLDQLAQRASRDQGHDGRALVAFLSANLAEIEHIIATW